MKSKILVLTLALCATVALQARENWQPAGEHIRTRWAAEVSPSNAHPEYPRPQMVRGSWRCLNGLWDYAVAEKDSERMPSADGRILVPFAIESSLSGVGRTFTAEDALWYARTFRIPLSWRFGKKVLLHFDAVDYECEVWLNGHRLGEHRGGYSAFSFDVTGFIRRGRQTLVLKVLDATDNDLQPRGKQVSNPRGIWYTAVSGIWQSVWMEAVGRKGHVLDYDAVADLSGGTVTVTPLAEGGEEVKVELLEGCRGYDAAHPGTKVIASAVCTPGEGAVLKLDRPHFWSPDDPYLYGLRLSLLKDGKVVDRVEGYTAYRGISKVRDGDGHLRMALNGDILFQYGPLDQGWWPDGLYTAPTDEALAYDVERTKEYGFNAIRKHIKVEPSRWYYHCDRLGMLVWQDMPSVADCTVPGGWAQGRDVYDEGSDDQLSGEARKNYLDEWTEIVTSHRKFPCIVVWVPFNEAWGQFNTAEVVEYTRSLDGTRLINMASGGNWISGGVGDILDSHYYPSPKMRILDDAMVNVLGEYGGIGLPVEGHTWVNEDNWGYVQFKTGDEATAQYEKFAAMIPELVKEQGCSAAIYTQTTDVEHELNGFMTYDREVDKLDPARVAAANRKVIEVLAQ